MTIGFEFPVGDALSAPSSTTLRRLKSLGLGTRTDRRRAIRACGSQAAADQWIHRMVTEGLLVPVAWGEYQVVGQDTMLAMMWPSSSEYRRLLAWVETLPRAVDSGVSFLGPRVWKETDLAVWHPIPVLPVPESATTPNPPAQLGAVEYSVHRREVWQAFLPGGRAVRVPVPSRLDACILLGSNADPRWQEASKKLFHGLTPPEQRRAVVDLRRLRRFNGVGYRTRNQTKGGDPIIRLPSWWRTIHEEAVSFVMGSVYGR